MMHSQPTSVALVGRRLRDNDNLGLAYLVAALEAESIGAQRFKVNAADDLDRVAAGIMAGDFRVDLERLVSPYEQCVGRYPGLHVFLDPAGNVSSVGQSEGGGIPEDALDCVYRALQGLTFACLASSEVCPEFICAE